MAAVGFQGGVALSRFVSWDEAQRPVVMTDHDQQPLVDVDFASACFLSQARDGWRATLAEGAVLNLSRAECASPRIACSGRSALIACANGSAFRWVEGQRRTEAAPVDVPSGLVPTSASFSGDRYWVSYRETTPVHAGGRLITFGKDSGGARVASLPALNVGFGLFISTSSREGGPIALQMPVAGKRSGARLLQLTSTSSSELALPAALAEPDFLAAFDVERTGAVWSIIDSFSQPTRLCVLPAAADPRPSSWACSVLRVAATAGETRTAVTALHVAGTEAWVGTAMAGVSHARRAPGDDAAQFIVDSHLPLGRTDWESFERADWAPRVALP